MSPRKPRLPFANAWFFPAAALYAALLLPWSILTLLGLVPALPGLATPAGHAHEMLFGFALAVVAGYLLGPQRPGLTLALLSCWCLARLGFLLWPGSWFATLAAIAFAIGLAWNVVPRFLGAAKKWRNQTVAPVVVGLSLLSAGAGLALARPFASTLLHEALLLLALLMFFMGGRILAPAIAGHALSQRRSQDARVQPWLEGSVLIVLLVALLLNLLSPWLATARLTGSLMLLAGVLTFIRLLRWRPWQCLTRPDLLVLLLGYAWLALGLVLTGLAIAGLLPLTAMLHSITVGALGSLTFGVMARTRLIYRFRDANARPWIHPVVLLISLAAVARMAPGLPGTDQRLWLLGAAVCWSLAFLSLAVLLWQTRGAHPNSGRHDADTD
ncbi:NnrS family protein [Stutzerimonas nitrititolerans]|uniref:NnrS family protein n=1 Tax=Stutzerimonas nitrititolerans TaxID=2482751 RepID=UPI002896F4D3|nr:NnrS family protein [Stutzerimonas nitrititolerans]